MYIAVCEYREVPGEEEATNRNVQFFFFYLYYSYLFCSYNQYTPTTLVSFLLDAQNYLFIYLFIYNTFIKILYMFRAVRCSSSGGLIVSMQHLISSLCKQVCCLKLLWCNLLQCSKLHHSNFRQHTCLQSDNIRCCIDTIRPPEDEQRTARNM